MRSLSNKNRDLRPRAPRRRMGRPSNAETELLNTHLLDIAEGLFLANGFDGTSIDVVAVQARASKSTIYLRYPNKNALFEAVIERLIDHVFADVEKKVRGGTTKARLESLLFFLIDRVLRPEVIALSRVLIAEGARFEELVRSHRRGHGSAVELVAKVLKAERDSGRITFAETFENAAEHLLALTERALWMRALLGEDLQQLRAGTKRFVRRGVSVFLHGCLVPEIKPSRR
jgi:TetR/AcrR family transcriptional regulator, mexJK operon transcriptional repressor